MDRDKVVICKDVEVKDGDTVIFIDGQNRRHKGVYRGNRIERDEHTHLIFRVECKVQTERS